MREISLNSSERTILECLWENSPRTMIEIWHALEAKTGWTKSTANTLTGRMAGKGSFMVEEGRKAKLYSPAILREEAAVAETQSLLRRAYNGSLSLMLSTLVKSEALSREDISELQKILEKAEESV